MLQASWAPVRPSITIQRAKALRTDSVQSPVAACEIPSWMAVRRALFRRHERVFS
ncbi:hypothetical protein BDV18DRAFT_138615 [Aspergillus unguis]